MYKDQNTICMMTDLTMYENGLEEVESLVNKLTDFEVEDVDDYINSKL